jgi:hypothetical protein
VAVLEATTAYKLNGSLPVVGTSTTVFAAIGRPVAPVDPMASARGPSGTAISDGSDARSP